MRCSRESCSRKSCARESCRCEKNCPGNKNNSRSNAGSQKNYSRRYSSGFTLLEVLIALAILAISAAALLRQTQLQVKQQFELELKTYAMWVADDTLSALSAQPQWPPLGRNEQQVTFHEQQWLITTDVQATADPLLRKVEVGVNLATDTDAKRALVSFTTFRGRY